MKNKGSLLSLVTLIVACMASVCHADNEVKVFFSGDGFSVTQEDLTIEEEMLSENFQTTSDEKLRVILMDRLFTLAMKEETAPLLDKKIQRMTERYLSLLYKKKIRESIEISDLVLESFYKSNPELFTLPGKFDLSMIMVPHKFLCENLFSAITKGGRDFEEAAQAESVDEPTRSKKGALGWIVEKRLPKAFVIALDKLSGNQGITSPFEFNGNWVLLKKKAYAPPELKPFNEVRETIKARLTGKEMRVRMSLEFERLKKVYRVK